MKDSYRFFQNRDCEFFPCHRCEREDEFNCLFCYCPLYALGKSCPGEFVYLDNGVKDCSGCLLPHRAQEYDTIISRFRDIRDMMKRLKEMERAALPSDAKKSNANS